MTIGLILVPLLAVAACWWLLNARETRRAASGLQRHSALRLIVIAIFGLAALFSGGCSLVLLAPLLQGPQQYLDVYAVTIVGGIPFAISALIWWLFMRRKAG
jgi:hypothetical protein